MPAKKRSESFRELEQAKQLPPEDGLPVDVLPGVLIHVVVIDGDEEVNAMKWPQLAVCAPVIGDGIRSICGKGNGIVFQRQHWLHSQFGPVVSVFVRVESNEE